jgi:hypothetical protein
MVPRRFASILCVLASALTGCAQPVAAPPIAPCQPLPGAEALLAEPAAGLIVIGADSASEGAALLLTACAALTNGERVAAFLPSGPQWDAARAIMAAWATQGATIAVSALPAPSSSDRPTAQSELAGALEAATRASEVDRAVALVDAESAARRPLGLSGETWTPAGAMLPADGAITLRALAAPSTTPRLTLEPFEDVAGVGPARAYDGLITLPVAQDADAGAALRGRR